MDSIGKCDRTSRFRSKNLRAMLKETDSGTNDYRAIELVKRARKLNEEATLQLWLDWNFAIAIRKHKFTQA